MKLIRMIRKFSFLFLDVDEFLFLKYSGSCIFLSCNNQLCYLYFLNQHSESFWMNFQSKSFYLCIGESYKFSKCFIMFIFFTWKMPFSQGEQQQLAMNAVSYLIVTISIKKCFFSFFLSCYSNVCFISSLNCFQDAPKKIIEEGQIVLE